MKHFLGSLFIVTVLLGAGVVLVAVAPPAGSVFAQTQSIQEFTACTSDVTDDDEVLCVIDFCTSNKQQCTDFCTNNLSVCIAYATANNISLSSLGQQTQVSTTGGVLEDCNPIPPRCESGLTCKNGICVAELPAGPQSGGEILRIIDAIGDWVFGIFMLIAIIFILLALFDFVTGGGDPAKISSARQKLIYAAIGVGLALVAGGVDNVLQNILLP